MENLDVYPGSPGKLPECWERCWESSGPLDSDPDLNLEKQVRIEMLRYQDFRYSDDPHWPDRLPPLMDRHEAPEPVRDDEWKPLLDVMLRVFRRSYLPGWTPATEASTWAAGLWFQSRPSEYLPRILAYRVFHGPWRCPALKRAAARFIRAPWVDQGRLVMTLLNRAKSPHSWAYHWGLTHQLSSAEMARVPWPATSPEIVLADPKYPGGGTALHLLRGGRVVPLLRYVSRHARFQDPPDERGQGLFLALIRAELTDVKLADLTTCLWKGGARLDRWDARGNTGLHRAFKLWYFRYPRSLWDSEYLCGQPDIDPAPLAATVSTLLAAGVDLNAVNDAGERALDFVRHDEVPQLRSVIDAILNHFSLNHTTSRLLGQPTTERPRL